MSGPLDTFPRLLLDHARRRGGRPAMREKDLGIWQTFSWQQVADEVRALACGLAALGFQRGEHLAIIGDNRPRLYWAIAAAQALGGIPVPLYQDAVADEMVFVLADADVRFVVVEDQEQVDKLFELRERLPALKLLIYDDPRGLRNYPTTCCGGTRTSRKRDAPSSALTPASSRPRWSRDARKTWRSCSTPPGPPGTRRG